MIQKAHVPAICKWQVEVWRQSKAFGPDVLLLCVDHFSSQRSHTPFPHNGLSCHAALSVTCWLHFAVLIYMVRSHLFCKLYICIPSRVHCILQYCRVWGSEHTWIAISGTWEYFFLFQIEKNFTFFNFYFGLFSLSISVLSLSFPTPHPLWYFYPCRILWILILWIFISIYFKVQCIFRTWLLSDIHCSVLC